MQVRRDGFYKVRGEVKDRQLIKENIDPYGFEGLSHV